MTKSEKQARGAVLRISEHRRKRVDELETDLDALFRLPLTEFTGARNTLAARLKKSGRGDDAALVKALIKPPISAWAVNQLYWNHREAFDQLIASGERFHKAQRSGKVADMRTALDARREALTDLSDLATSLLRDADHNPSLDIIRRITTTLEAMSAMSDWASRPDARYSGRPGRLTRDVEPPGFESLASFVPGMIEKEAGGRRQSAGGGRQAAGVRRQEPSRAKQGHDARQGDESRKAKVAAAKVSLQDAKRSLTAARARAQRLEGAQKKADLEAKKAEKHKRDVAETLEKAKAAAAGAAQRARSAAVQVEEAARAVDDAERGVENASKELESVL